MDDTEVRQIAERVYQARAAADAVALRFIALERERQVYLQLVAQHGSGSGWRVWHEPLHRVEEKCPGGRAQVLAEIANYPLTNRIITHEGMEWLLLRPLNALTDEELNSAPQYREAYEYQVARGVIKPSRVLTTAS